MMKVSFFLALFAIANLVAGASAGRFIEEEPRFDIDISFDEWVDHHSKTYETHEELSRRAEVFEANKQMIKEHNAGGHSHHLVLNEYADMTVEEFNESRNGFMPHLAAKEGLLESTYLPKRGDVPDEIDWRSKNVVSPVKNQGQCGSCWAFSTTGSLESAYAIKTGKIETFSEQELINCSKNGNMGCRGGLITLAFEWIENINGGFDTEEDWPYHGPLHLPWCNKKKAESMDDKAAGVRKYTNVPKGDPEQLQLALLKQPISIAIDASHIQFYGGGVIAAKSCGTELDHAVLLVGYGTDSKSGTPYWLIKNSWGEGWGNSGYFMLERIMEKGPGACGINTAATYPEVGPPKPTH